MHLRKPMSALCCAFLWAVAVPATAETRYVYLVNDTPDRIEAFAIAQEDSDAWTPIDLGRNGMKAGFAKTIAIARNRGDGCVYDAKIVMRGRTFVHRGLDFCRYVSYHPGRYLRVSESAAAQPRMGGPRRH